MNEKDFFKRLDELMGEIISKFESKNIGYKGAFRCYDYNKEVHHLQVIIIPPNSYKFHLMTSPMEKKDIKILCGKEVFKHQNNWLFKDLKGAIKAGIRTLLEVID